MNVTVMVKKLGLNIIYCGLIVGILLVGWLAIVELKQKYPTTMLNLSGKLDYIAPVVIRSRVLDLLNNNLWIINVNKVKDRLYEDPWVQHVFVNKIWPNILKVNIVEHNPIAKWNNKFFITVTGKLLPLNDDFMVKKSLILPEFYGQNTQETQIIEIYLTLLEKLTTVGLFVSKIEIVPDGNIRVTLNNNVILKLGTFDLMDRVNRFIVIYKKKLQPIISDISYIDLRYTNGVAVGWAQKGGS